MDLQSFDALLTPEGQLALHAAEVLQPREVDYLQHFQTLSKRFPAGIARVALETAILRQEAAAKYPVSLAVRMYFIREALEQATSYEIAKYRAERFRRQLNPAFLVDLGCSIGSDTMTLATIAPTLGIDQDLLRLRIAQANLRELSSMTELSREVHQASFLQADLMSPLPISTQASTGLFFDPARRTGHQRIFSVSDYRPPLSIVNEWLTMFPALSVKLSPGVDLGELAGYQAEIEFISLHGELKECVLWFGPLRSTKRQATLLPSLAQMSSDELPDAVDAAIRISPPLSYLYEPDPAILRAGLVRQLAEEINAAQLDPDIAYLTRRDLTPTPFARTWIIEAWFPFQLKRLRSYLRQRGIGKVTVKKRGSPLVPEDLINSLRLEGDDERVLVLTHLNGKPIVLICLQPARDNIPAPSGIIVSSEET